MLTNTYKPTNISEFIGNKQSFNDFSDWLLNWDINLKQNNTNNKKCALISGKTGIGKSLLVELVLNTYNYNSIYLDTEQNNLNDYIKSFVISLIKQKINFNGKKNILVIQDIDTIYDTSSNFITNIKNCIQLTNIPIICICDNKYDQSIKPIINDCFDIKLNQPIYEEVRPLLKKIISREKIIITETELKNLFENSGSDIRFVLNSLQMRINNTVTDTKQFDKDKQGFNVFENAETLLNMDNSLENKITTYWLSPDINFLIIQENYINNSIGFGNLNDPDKKTQDYKILNNLEYLQKSANLVSEVDLFDCAVINDNNWEMQNYIAYGSVNITLYCNKKRIKFPTILEKIALSNKNNREKRNKQFERLRKQSSDKSNMKIINNEDTAISLLNMFNNLSINNVETPAKKSITKSITKSATKNKEIKSSKKK